jgi:hypothetical protein
VCGARTGLGQPWDVLPPLTATPAASFLSWGLPKYSTRPRATAQVLVSPLHRHQPCASALILIRTARCVRSSQPVGLLAAFVRRGAGVSQTTCAFRPCRSSRLRRLAPRITLRACCIPQPTLGFVPFPDHSGRPGVGHGDQPCHPRCFRQDLFPGTHDPSKPFPCTQPSYA